MPVGRIANILKQLDNIPLALASASQCQKFQGIVDSVIIFDEDLTMLDTSNDILPAFETEGGIQFDQPAYVIFTSGSTGKFSLKWALWYRCDRVKNHEEGVKMLMLTSY